MIYPSYIDANKTVKKGRRISVEDAVPNPTVIDIGQALQVTTHDVLGLLRRLFFFDRLDSF